MTNGFFILLVWQETIRMIDRFWFYLTRQFTFGRITVSVSSVLIGAVVVILTVVIARSVSKLIERRMAARRHIDPGLSYTIARLAKYLVLVLGILIALRQAFAIDLTSIAVIFTALSVGIGFGLQYLAADIASGFILLFERPIKVGDRIRIGDDEGDVQSINLRTTVITNNERVAIILPNSKLVSQRVVNWSFGDPLMRISISIGVADDSDIQLVTDTLLDAAKEVDNVLSEPPPGVQFAKFGEYSFDFRLLVWTDQPRSSAQIRSDFHYRIAKLFRERSIRIPYPTQEFLLRNLERRDMNENELSGD